MAQFDNDETLVIACVLGAATVTSIAQVTSKDSKLTVKPLVGSFILGTLLLGVGLWSPPVAKSFAVVLLVTTIIINGQPLFTAISRLTGNNATS